MTASARTRARRTMCVRGALLASQENKSDWPLKKPGRHLLDISRVHETTHTILTTILSTNFPRPPARARPPSTRSSSSIDSMDGCGAFERRSDDVTMERR